MFTVNSGDQVTRTRLHVHGDSEPIVQSHLHVGMREQWDKLKQKLHGHFAYYGITGNAEALERFRDEVKGLWHQMA
jgi:hypothetical protein